MCACAFSGSDGVRRGWWRCYGIFRRVTEETESGEDLCFGVMIDASDCTADTSDVGYKENRVYTFPQHFIRNTTVILGQALLCSQFFMARIPADGGKASLWDCSMVTWLHPSGPAEFCQVLCMLRGSCSPTSQRCSLIQWLGKHCHVHESTLHCDMEHHPAGSSP